MSTMRSTKSSGGGGVLLLAMDGIFPADADVRSSDAPRPLRVRRTGARGSAFSRSASAPLLTNAPCRDPRPRGGSAGAGALAGDDPRAEGVAGVEGCGQVRAGTPLRQEAGCKGVTSAG